MYSSLRPNFIALMIRTHRLYLDGQITPQGFGQFYKPTEEKFNQLTAELQLRGPGCGQTCTLIALTRLHTETTSASFSNSFGLAIPQPSPCGIVIAPSSIRSAGLNQSPNCLTPSLYSCQGPIFDTHEQ